MRNSRISLVDAPSFFDLAISTCGYESRATFFLEDYQPEARRKMAVGYGFSECLNFETNRDALSANGYEFSSVADADFKSFIESAIQECAGGEQHNLKVFVEMSCLTRFRLASLVEALCQYRVDVTFFYALATFSPPGSDEPANEFLEPVSPYFSGWSGDIDKPTAVISGLGYEHMKAIGVIDHLDAANTWLFFPKSPIVEYDLAVESANELLLRDIDPSHLLKYGVFEFSDLCRDLFALSSSLRQSYRCVVLPLGPKLFALASLLAGAAYKELAIWRVSAGGFATPTERAPSGHSCTFTVRFSPLGVQGE